MAGFGRLGAELEFVELVEEVRVVTEWMLFEDWGWEEMVILQSLMGGPYAKYNPTHHAAKYNPTH